MVNNSPPTILDVDDSRIENIGMDKLNSRMFIANKNTSTYWCGKCEEQSIELNVDRTNERIKFIKDEFGFYRNPNLQDRKIDYIIRYTDYNLGYDETSYWSCLNACEITFPIDDDRVDLPSCLRGDHRHKKCRRNFYTCKVGVIDMDSCLIFKTKDKMMDFLHPLQWVTW